MDGKKRLLVGSLVALSFLFLQACAPAGPLEDPKAECSRVGGEWKTFSNSCVDSCAYERNPGDIVCAQALTEGCECGPDRCWDGTTCVAN